MTTDVKRHPAAPTPERLRAMMEAFADGYVRAEQAVADGEVEADPEQPEVSARSAKVRLPIHPSQVGNGSGREDE